MSTERRPETTDPQVPDIGSNGPETSYIREALGLLNSMVLCGESHSKTSEQVVEAAWKELRAINDGPTELVHREDCLCVERTPSSREVMNANYYQEFTATTAIYADKGMTESERIFYCVLGLVGETGEVAEKMKKKLRGGGIVTEFADDPEMMKELGDVCWYLARLCSELDMTLGDVMHENMRKLSSRKDRGVLHGDGDNR